MPSGCSQPSLSLPALFAPSQTGTEKGPTRMTACMVFFWVFFSDLCMSISISSLLTAVVGAREDLTALPFPNFSSPAYAHRHLSSSLHGQGHPRPPSTPKSIALHPPTSGISSKLPSTTSSTFKSQSRKSELLPPWTPALSKAKYPPRSKTSLYICKEHLESELQALNTINAPVLEGGTGPLAFWTKQLSTRQDQGILSQSSGDL